MQEKQPNKCCHKRVLGRAAPSRHAPLSLRPSFKESHRRKTSSQKKTEPSELLLLRIPFLYGPHVRRHV